MTHLRSQPSRTHVSLLLGLYAAVGIPVIYFGMQAVAAPFYPGYSFARDIASLLGTTASSQPWIFNSGAVLTGVAGVVGAVGLVSALSRITSKALTIAIGLCVLSNAILSLKAGIYPLPDPRHATWQFLLVPTIGAPFLLVIAFWRNSPLVRRYLLVNAACQLIMLALMMHLLPVPSLGEGLTQRLLALFVFVPVGVIAYSLAARLRKGLPPSEDSTSLTQSDAASGLS